MTKKEQETQKIRRILQSCHINFLLGAGCSYPCIDLLGEVEKDMIDKDTDKAAEAKKKLAHVVKKCWNINEQDADYKKTYQSYDSFINIMYKTLLERENNIISKQINIFTTNYDIFLEKILSDKEYIYNDGFQGGLKPRFDTANFRKRYYQSALHYDNVYEIPSFNVYKIHGSVSWKKEGDFYTLRNIKNTDDTNDLLESIVLPTPEKLKETIINPYYYDLLRLFANALEIENSILFIIGFSIRDEHIETIIKRALKNNLTIKIYIADYDCELISWKEKHHQVEILCGEKINLSKFSSIIESSLNNEVEQKDD